MSSNQLLLTALAVVAVTCPVTQFVEAANIPQPESPPPAKTASPVRKTLEQNPTLTSEEWSETVLTLRGKHLLLPISGMQPSVMKGSFYQKRGSDAHRAADILAPRDTPVLAVDDGPIGKLFTSVAGGITIYQFDKSGKYIYYYAHLERYADDLVDGAAVKRGQVIGYVGTSGNAPKDTPHLHFAIYKAREQGQWWRGAPVDPFEVYDGQAHLASPRSQPVTRVSPRIWI